MRELSNKISVQMINFNNSYGDNVFIPYTAGILQAYFQHDNPDSDGYEFRPFVYRRNSVDSIVGRIGMVDILGISCYMWNWRLNMEVAAAVRKANKNCLIIIGGPQVPDKVEGFFEKHPYIDVAVHGEGEETFRQILLTYRRGGPLQSVPGSSYHDRKTGKVYPSGKRREDLDLKNIPSPYLTGVFAKMMPREKADWVASWETNRGCPFTCSYCYWGGRSKTIRTFEMERLIREIEWFGTNKIHLVFGCDANMGILKRDIELVRLLAKAKKDHGYPRTFRVCSTKNSNDAVFNIEKTLNEAAMAKGVSLSMQSLSTEVLKNIRRVNIKIDTFHDLQARYVKAGLATYTEIILALPGETFETFRNGINTLLENGQHSQLHVYSCTVLVNSELGDDSYQKKHGIRTVQIPIFQAHSTPDQSSHHVAEYENIVVSTDSMPLNDWLRAWQFSWAVLCFHYLGIFQMIAIFLYGRYKIKYGHFYEFLVKFAKENPQSHIGRELRKFNGVLDNVLAGEGFSQTIREFGDIVWPPEEASFLRLVKNRTGLYNEAYVVLCQFLSENKIVLEKEIIENLLRYQKVRLVHYTDGHHPDNNFHISLDYNLPEYINGIMKGKPCPLRRQNRKYTVVRDHNFAGDKKRFSRETIWYGRKGGRYLYSVKC